MLKPGMKVLLDTPLQKVGTIKEVGVDGFFCIVDFDGAEIGVEASKLKMIRERLY